MASSVQNFALRHRGLLLNLALSLLGLLLGGVLTQTAAGAVYHKEPSFWLATLLLLFWVGEFVLLPLKLQDVFARADIDPDSRSLTDGLLVGGLLFRLILDVLLLRLFASSIGWGLTSKHKAFPWIVGFFLIKALLGYLTLLWARKHPHAWKDFRSLLLDVFFLGFYTLLLALYWDTVVENTNSIRSQELALLYLDLFGAGVVFLLIFFPLRLPYLMEELLRKRTWLESGGLMLSFVCAMTVALLPLYNKATRGRYNDLTKALKQPDRVKSLYLQQQKRSVLPDSIGILGNLQELSLYGMGLTSLPPSIGKLQRLKKLNAMSNRLTRLPDNIAQWKQLQELKLRNNKLTRLPSTIGGLRSLQKLDLRHNHLQSLPSSFAKLTNLRKLYLSHNRFREFPAVLCKLPKLRVLLFRHNKIQRLPRCIRHFDKLRYVNLYGNPVYHRWLRLRKSPSRSRQNPSTK
jgi:hypothetical protein